jgi:hypothetical protein
MDMDLLLLLLSPHGCLWAENDGSFWGICVPYIINIFKFAIPELFFLLLVFSQ